MKIKSRNKIGFHTGPGGNPSGIGDWMRALDGARVPFFLKSVDSYGPIFEAAQLAKQSGVDHVLIYRLSSGGQGHVYDFDVPPYKDPKYVNDPEGGAALHWRRTLERLPPEFDKQRVWIEPINEVDKNLCDWLGRFAVHTANLAQRDGYKVSLFAWSSGEPEPAGWEEPGMLAYLRLCAERPHQAAVALHEYSYVVDDIDHQRPYKIGRFKFLFDVCDKHGIARPTVHITEWGWTLDNVPPPEQAIRDMKNVGALYARYPEIKGAAIWYLGPGFGGIANKAQRLIKPAADFTLTHQFEAELDKPVPPQPVTPPPEPEPPTGIIGPPPVPAEPPPTPRPPRRLGLSFLEDVTIPDDTRLQSGEQFTKKWRVKNSGNVSWTRDLRLAHVGGEAMTRLTKRIMPETASGAEATITVHFQAPLQPGVYFSDWRLMDEDGAFHGDILFTRIIVEKPVDTGVSGSAYVADVTIPDDMEMSPGLRFVKKWRVKNTGTRPWGPHFTLDFVGGVPMTSSTRIPLPTVAPGQEAEIAIPLSAPEQPGVHYGDWRIRDDRGFLFGDVIYLRIKVSETAAAPEIETPLIETELADTPEVTRLQAGVNINPDAPHSNPVETGDANGLEWVRFVFKVDARVNAAERGDLQAAFAQYDPLIAACDRMGVKALLVINQETVWGSAPWAGGGDWNRYATELARVAGQIAARYRSYKDRVAFEIWNEGDLRDNVSSVFVPPDKFALILRQTAAAIKRAAPRAQRVFGGLAAGPLQAVAYLNQVRQALGGELPVEAIGIHPYGRWGTIAPFDWGDKFGTLSQAVAEYAPGTGGLPLWITEIGVAADVEIGPAHYPAIAGYMRDIYRTVATRHVVELPVVIWFAWSDWMRNAGIVDRNGRRKAAVYAAFEDIRDSIL